MAERGRSLAGRVATFFWSFGLVIGGGGVLAARPMSAAGAWAQSEAVVCAVLVGAALCLAGQAAATAGGGGAARHSPLVLLPLSLAAWSAVVAPLALFPGTALLGPPQSGLGAVWFLAQAAFTAAALELRAEGRLLDGAALIAAAAALIAALCNLRHLPWLQPLLAPHGLLVDIPIFGFNEHLAYPALALAAFGAARWSDGRRELGGVVLGAALVVLIVSRNRTALAVAPAAALLPMLGTAVARRFAFGLRRVFPAAAIAVAAALLLPLLVLRFADLSQAPFSLLSRQVLIKVLEPSLFSDGWAMLFGHGWGHYQEYLARNVGGLGLDLVSPSWADLNRDEFHSHNALLEAYFSVGLPGLLLWVFGWAAVVSSARRRAVAWAFVLAWTVVDSMWFPLPTALAIQAMAVAALAGPLPSAGPPVAARRVAAVLLAGAMILAGAAGRQRLQSQELEVLRACMAATVGARGCAFPAVPADPRGSDLGLATLLAEGRERGGSELPTLIEEAGRRCRDGCALQLSIALINHHAAKVLAGSGLDSSNSAAAWREEEERILARAPGRMDLIAPYLNWLVATENEEALRDFVQSAARIAPDHPVTAWFSGVLLVGSDHRAALALMRKALNDGVERYMPVPDTVKTLLKVPTP